MARIDRHIKKYAALVIILALLVLTALPALLAQTVTSTGPELSLRQSLKLLDAAYDTISDNYVEPVPPYDTIIEFLRGVEAKVGDTGLLEKSDSEYRPLSPVSDKPISPSISKRQAGNVLKAILHDVAENHPEVPPNEIAGAGLSNMLFALDSHTSFLTPDTMREMLIDTKGEFSGVGIVVTMKSDALVVVSPIEGSPADLAGIREKDQIIKIDGKPVKGLSLIDTVRRIRGPRGSNVVLTFVRKGREAPFDVRLTRDVIPVRSVKYAQIPPDIGYIRITTFNDNTTEDLNKAIDTFETDVPAPKGLVLDLRNNPGGLLNQAVQVSDLFLDRGTIVSLRGRKKRNTRTFTATSDTRSGGYPIVLLINGGSASASEILAGAMQDHKKGLLLGETTFGKGSVQTIESLPYDHGIKYTLARYYTPGGRSIEASGITPDVNLPLDQNNGKRATESLEKDESTDQGERSEAPSDESGPAERRYGRLSLDRLQKDRQVLRAVEVLKRTPSAEVSSLRKTARLIEQEEASRLSTAPGQQRAESPTPGVAGISASDTAFRPRLFVLSIGVSRYSDPDLHLKYARNDAEALVRAFREQPTTLFREIRTEVLTDDEVTRDRILETMSRFLGRAVSTDVVIIFVAGHGVQRSSTGTFYFLPHAASRKNLSTKGLRWSDFEEEVKYLSSRVNNVILILDTCHSGALNLSMRGIQVGGDLSSPFQQSGLFVLAAARSGEGALEKAQWRHGAFTYAILEGLSGKADFNENKEVDIVELFHYVEEKVAEMTDGRQHPHFRMGGGSLPVYALP